MSGMTMHFEHIFRSLVENTNDVIMVLDATPLEQGGPFIVYVNPAFERLMGYSAEEVMGQNPKILQGPDTDDKTRFKMRQAMRAGRAIRIQILNYDKFGNELWLDINMVPLDVDHFKDINDRYGHAVGDQVLRQVSAICQSSLRASDVLGRIGGEEFVLLLPDTPQANAIFVAERMREQLEKTPIDIDGLVITVTASFGVASLNDADLNFNHILERADEAMYHAKHDGRNRVKSAA
ncbi:MAG: diguanylate cyclase [Gammaproteobacteria bacterium]